jgi:hypothetical protein
VRPRKRRRERRVKNPGTPETLAMAEHLVRGHLVAPEVTVPGGGSVNVFALHATQWPGCTWPKGN